jgi:hypothetical protein
LTSCSLPDDLLSSSTPPAWPGPEPTPPAGLAENGDGPLADPLAEATRLIDHAREAGLTVRVLGGVAVYMSSPNQAPLLPRTLKDIDLVTARNDGRGTAQLLEGFGYQGEEMFNALHGSRRLLFRDPGNGRDLDVFVGVFEMCHNIPVSDRLDRHPYTVPLAELMLTKLQVVQLNERDERDIFTLCYHHEVGDHESSGIESDVIARLCAEDWGLWRTCIGTIERCLNDIDRYELQPAARDLIRQRLNRLWEGIEAAPKTGKWKRRSRLGDRIRWYQEPEEVEQ